MVPMTIDRRGKFRVETINIPRLKVQGSYYSDSIILSLFFFPVIVVRVCKKYKPNYGITNLMYTTWPHLNFCSKEIKNVHYRRNTKKTKNGDIPVPTGHFFSNNDTSLGISQVFSSFQCSYSVNKTSFSTLHAKS